jgi:hypothetical protein
LAKPGYRSSSYVKSFSPSMNLPRKAQGKEGKTLIGEMAVWYWLKKKKKRKKKTHLSLKS